MTERIGRCGHALVGRQLVWCSDECSKKAAREALLEKRFTLTPAEYDAILQEQGGICPICTKAPKGKHYPVDHDHKTGLVRGIPCSNCNLRFIGRHTGATAQMFRNAAEYLENPPARRIIGDRIAPGRPRAKRKIRRRKAVAR